MDKLEIDLAKIFGGEQVNFKKLASHVRRLVLEARIDELSDKLNLDDIAWEALHKDVDARIAALKREMEEV